MDGSALTAKYAADARKLVSGTLLCIDGVRKSRIADDANKMPVCDDCDRGFHLYCVNPKLSSVPEGMVAGDKIA